MTREQQKRCDPLKAIHKLIQERYSKAKAIFWAGSVSQNMGTEASDLDLVIVYDNLIPHSELNDTRRDERGVHKVYAQRATTYQLKNGFGIPYAYREAYIFEGWPIDAFIHDPDTLRYIFEESRIGKGVTGLSHMILYGREILAPNDFSLKIKMLAQEIIKSGPAVWNQERIDKERFLITDALDDIKFPQNRNEQIASSAWLFEALGQFYFRAQNKWCASGKCIVRYIKKDNPELALEFSQAFEIVFQTGDTKNLELVVQKILAPYGGLLWDGFRANSPSSAKLAQTNFDPLKQE